MEGLHPVLILLPFFLLQEGPPMATWHHDGKVALSVDERITIKSLLASTASHITQELYLCVGVKDYCVDRAVRRLRAVRSMTGWPASCAYVSSAV